jgi:hypothetical protein
VVGAAFWKGGPSERIAAAGFLVAWFATPLLVGTRHGAPPWISFAIDTLFFLLLLGLALRSGRWWPLAAAAFELLSVLTHVARLIDPGVYKWAYLTADIFWTYLLLATIALGTFNRWHERRQLAMYGAAIAEPGATRR